MAIVNLNPHPSGFRTPPSSRQVAKKLLEIAADFGFRLLPVAATNALLEDYRQDAKMAKCSGRIPVWRCR